jgi:hypothetical protein
LVSIACISTVIKTATDTYKRGFTFTSHLFLGNGVIVGQNPVTGEDGAARLSVFPISYITKFLDEDDVARLRRA